MFSRPVLIGRGLGLTSARARSGVLGDSYPLDNRFPVAMAAVSHPFPSRTRQLSPPAPMVLGGRPPGRVGRRRISHAKRPLPQRQGALVVFRPAGRIACYGRGTRSTSAPRQGSAAGRGRAPGGAGPAAVPTAPARRRRRPPPPRRPLAGQPAARGGRPAPVPTAP